MWAGSLLHHPPRRNSLASTEAFYLSHVLSNETTTDVMTHTFLFLCEYRLYSDCIKTVPQFLEGTDLSSYLSVSSSKFMPIYAFYIYF